MLNEYPHKWLAFAGIALLSFGCYLDYTIVNVALPTIQRDLQTNLSLLQWVMNIYFLALCILATIMGRCGDLYGRRRCFYIGVITFAVASVIAGFAPTISWLILGRLLQGIGAAIVLPLGPSLLPESFPEHERGKAIAWFGSLGGIGLALGPVLGGIIVTHWGWRWIFFINIPIAILGYLFCHNYVKKSMIESVDRTLDWKGMLLLTFTMSGLILSLIHSQTAGWMNGLTLSYLAIAIIAAILLIKVERGQTSPLIDFKDFSNLLFHSGAGLVFIAGVLSAVVLFFDPIYLQVIRKESPELSGWVLFAIPAAVTLVAFLVGRLIHQFGIFSTIVIGLSIALLSGLLQLFFTPITPLWYVIITFIVLGSMWALGNTAPIIAAQTAVGPKRASVATGTIVTMFNMGGSIGLAIAVVVFHFSAAIALKNISQLHPTQISADQWAYLKNLISNPTHALQTQTNDLIHGFFNHIFMRGFYGVTWFLLIIVGIIFVSILWHKMVNLSGK